MRATWYHAQWPLLDVGDAQRDGSVSVFLDYNLGSWTFGVRFEPDPCWYDINLDLGPFSLSAIYWRKP